MLEVQNKSEVAHRRARPLTLVGGPRGVYYVRPMAAHKHIDWVWIEARMIDGYRF